MDVGNLKTFYLVAKSKRGRKENNIGAVISCCLPVELAIIAKDAFLVERQSTRRRQIGSKPRASRDAIVQRHQSRVFGFPLCHRSWKGVAQAGDHLEQ